MNKEKVIYGVSAGVLIVLIIGIIGWISIQEIQKGKEENRQTIQQEQGRLSRPMEKNEMKKNENDPRSEGGVKSVVEADATLEEMDRLANELETGEETPE